MKQVFILILVLVLIPLNVFAINYELEIVGNNTLTVGEKLKLQSDFIVLNDMCRGIPDCQLGEVERTNVSTSTVWSSSNKKVATVSASGIVTGISEGTVVINAVYKKNGLEEVAKKTIIVKKKVESNTVTKEPTTIIDNPSSETTTNEATESNNNETSINENNSIVTSNSGVTDDDNETNNNEFIGINNGENTDSNNVSIVNSNPVVGNAQVIEVPDTLTINDYLLTFLGISLVLGTIVSIVIYKKKMNIV